MEVGQLQRKAVQKEVSSLTEFLWESWAEGQFWKIVTATQEALELTQALQMKHGC